MAITNGAGASVVGAPDLGSGSSVVPVLQAQDGSFVGIGGDGMVAFDATGGTRWTVPNDSPMIATADGGVIGQSGTIYDQNGNAVDQMANIPTYSWIQAAYLSIGGQVAQVLQPPANWAASYQGIAGGNFSSNETSVGIAPILEGMLAIALPIHFSPTCQWQAPGTGVKVPLTGDALQRYRTEKQQLLAGNSLASTSCSNFLNNQLGNMDASSQYPDRLLFAITQLPPPPELPTPYDGLQTNISWYEAGFGSEYYLTRFPSTLSTFQGSPVCGSFVTFKGQHGGIGNPQPGRTTAAAQVRPTAGATPTDIYINTELVQTLDQATIVHEALHNVTRLDDYDLELYLGLTPQWDCPQDSTPQTCPCKTGSMCITDILRKNGCGGAN